MKKKSLVLATCDALRDGHPEDLLLQGFLGSQGWEVQRRVWSEDTEDSDAITWVRTTWDYHRRSAEFLKWTESRRRLLNSAALIKWNFSKEYLAWMNIMGLPTVPSHVLAVEDARIPYAEHEEVCVKPLVSASAERTYRVPRCDLDDPSRSREIWASFPEGRLLLQPYLPSVAERGEVSLVFFKDQQIRYSHGVLKKPADGDFRVQTEFGGTYERFFPDPALIGWCLQFLGQLHDTWISVRVDILDWETEPLLGELELIEPQLFLPLAPESLGYAWDALEHHYLSSFK